MKKKKSTQPTPSPCSSPKLDASLELDIRALRGKNKQLIQAVAKLQQDKKSQQDMITSLQEDFFNLNSKYVNLKTIFSNIDVATKVIFPKQMELTEKLGKIMQLCAVGVTISNLNKDPVTQTVAPHNVNGHVLQNPTITLSRFTDSPSNTPTRNSSPVTNRNNSFVNARRTTGSGADVPSCSRAGMVDENGLAVTRRRTANSDEPDAVNSSGDESLEEEENRSELEVNSPLRTIQEEDEDNYNSTLLRDFSQSGLSEVSGRVREIKIFLDPLPQGGTAAKNNGSASYLNCSVSDQPSASGTLETPENALKFLTSAIDAQSFSFSASSPLKAGFRSCSGRSEESSEAVRVQVARGKYRVLDEACQEDAESTGSDDSSVIEPVRLNISRNVFSSSCSKDRNHLNCESDCSFSGSSCVDMDVSKVDSMKRLGLEPRNSQLMVTSTPVVNTPRTSLRNRNRDSSATNVTSSRLSKNNGGRSTINAESPRLSIRALKLHNSFENVTKLSPTGSKVTKRKGGSKEKQVVQVLLKRISGEKKKLGRPRKVLELLETPPITKQKDMRRSRKRSGGDQDDLSLKERAKNALVSSSKNNNTINRNNKTISKLKGKGKRHSPRPKRAARPTELKEPSLTKKMRRSR